METGFDRKLVARAVVLSAFAFSLGSMQAHADAEVFGSESTVDQSALSNAFRSMDSDNDGTLDKNEIRNDRMFKDSGSFAAADKNNNGLVDMDEYSQFRRQNEEQNVKRLYNDAELVTKVKAMMVKDAGLKTLKINVDAYKGTVILSGFVDSKAQAQAAERIAKGVQGVEQVKNSLVVKGS